MLLFLAAALVAWLATRSREDSRPFQATLLLVGSGLLVLAAVVFPYAVPWRITLWEASSPRDSQLFLLAGVIVLTPVVRGYTAFAYWVFRGKEKVEAAS